MKLYPPHIPLTAVRYASQTMAIKVVVGKLLSNVGSTSLFYAGAVFLPASIAYLIGTNLFGPLAHKIGR